MTKRTMGVLTGSLVNSIVVDLTPEQERMVIAIDTYSFDKVLERIRKDGRVPEGLVDEAVVEFKRFLTLIALGHHQVGMTSEAVDEIWHTHILFTVDYTAFCDEVFGFYIHHFPDTSLSPIMPGSGERFFSAYEQVFGKTPPAIWGQRSDCDRCSGSTACQSSPGGCDSGNCNVGGGEGDK
ncbi:MAG: hypothetical protein WD883_00440 [Candidatus Colwellbacteria bacterium]